MSAEVHGLPSGAHGEPSLPRLTRRQQVEAAVYDARTREAAPSISDQDLRVDPSVLPLPNREHADFLSAALAALGDVNGARVLETGCGSGTIAVYLALKGARVVGVDVSRELVSVAERRAAVNGVADRTEFRVMPVEQLQEPDGAFDRIVGNQVLHHFDLPSALPNIRRLLRPGGHAAFCEPVLLIPEAFRRLRDSRFVTRWLPRRVDTPTERSLSLADLELIASELPGVRITPFQLLTRVRNFVPLDDGWFDRLWAVDQALLRRFPFSQRLCRFVVIAYTAGATNPGAQHDR